MFEYILTEQAKQLSKELKVDFTPSRATKLSAGYDLRYCGNDSHWIYPNQVLKVSTGVKIFLGTRRRDNATTFIGAVFPRSSSNGLVLENTIGVCDADYQGEVFCKLKNITDEPILVVPGQKIAQYIIIPVWIPNLLEVDTFSECTDRGIGGDGHTGKF
jgi:dUTP pyrophosphatase